jgi:hypothetical protein
MTGSNGRTLSASVTCVSASPCKERCILISPSASSRTCAVQRQNYRAVLLPSLRKQGMHVHPVPISVSQAVSQGGKIQRGRYLRVRPANVVPVLGEISLHRSRVPSIVANPLRFNSISNCKGAALLVALEGCEHAAIVRPEPAGRGLCF